MTTEAIPLVEPVNADLASTRAGRPFLDLFLVSFLILFFELAAIRWFGSMVVFLTFFTNIVLIACFLGMSVGLLAASRKQNFIRWVMPLTLVSVGLALATYWGYHHYSERITIDAGNQQSPQLIYFGTEYRPNDPSRFVIPMEAIAGIFFVLIAVTFVGLGQVMGRAFGAIPNRVAAYSVDILGSLTGIAAFGLASWFELTPTVWFLVVLVVLLYFVPRWSWLQVMGALGVLFLVSVSAHGTGLRDNVLWSPYYKITYTPQTREIDTNNIAHQQMLDIRQAGPAYALPHLLNRDAGGAAFDEVLIIGAGSGNDVSAALNYGARRIDAVEIDPVINRIGRADHPDQPYGDPRVSIHLDDGRSFIRRTENQYDLAIYALVDSLVLHSGYSSIRLESFLFTEQAFRDVKSRLKPGGVFAMYNYYRQGWVIGRLAKMAEQVFGVKPLVISLPFQETITSADNQANHITFLLVGEDSDSLERIRRSFEENQAFWINQRPELNEGNHFSAVAPGDGAAEGGAWQKIAPATVDIADIDLLPTDDWPQLYLRKPEIPTLNLRGAAMIAVLSLVILFSFAPVRRIRPNGRMFFLGAGFMLLETKGVVHMALLFGSTWVVNSVVFFAILVMILFANLYVVTFKPRKLWPYYAGLIAALAVNTLVPMDQFLALPGVMKTIVSCGVVYIPIFFAGVIFAAVFRDSKQPDVDFGSNVAGIILGGLSEYLSLVVGFNHLLLLAIGYYGLSAVFRARVGFRPAPIGAAGLLALLLITPGCAVKSPPTDEVFQVSTFDTLLSGQYDGVMSLREVKKHGDIGLGTFDKLHGELVLLDGQTYRVRSDGGVDRVFDEETTPLTVAKFFRPDQTLDVPRDFTLAELADHIDRHIPTTNWFYAVRIDGTFAQVRTRSVPAQERPYRELIEIVKDQPTFDFENVKGTLIGFRCPVFAQGLNVPAYHWHFLTEDRRRGGHVLELRTMGATARIDASRKWLIHLPESSEFRSADFTRDRAGELKTVESGETPE